MQRIPGLVTVMLTMWHTTACQSLCQYSYVPLEHVKMRIVRVPVLDQCTGCPLLPVVKTPDNVAKPKAHTSPQYDTAITIQGLPGGSDRASLPIFYSFFILFQAPHG